MNNDVIIRMALAAGLEQDGDNFFSRNYDQIDVHIDDLKRFAELIVKECLSYTKDGDLDFMKFMIKKHFGVEE